MNRKQFQHPIPLAEFENGPTLSKITNTPRRYLVFTSAGGRNSVKKWLSSERDFDIWVAWYGKDDDTLIDDVDYYLRRPGAKFQNLHYCFQRWPELFERYDAVMVMDDDIWISAAKIDHLFSLREYYDLWALQPAYTPLGKVSHLITRVRRDSTLRFVNFIETTCPLFRMDKLRDFLSVYDPVLTGWGTDWWFMHTMGPDLENRIAIIDSVVCLNPHDAFKPGGDREIERLQPNQQRRETWERIRITQGVVTDNHREFGSIFRTGWSRYAMKIISLFERLAVRFIYFAKPEWKKNKP